MNQETVFLAAIRAEPNEDVHRLAYGDWLDECGDPRGEFIRTQCLLARLADNDPARAELLTREAELLKAHQWDWTEGNFLAWLKHKKEDCHNPLGHGFCQAHARGLYAKRQCDLLPESDPKRRQFQRAVTAAAKRLDSDYGYMDGTCEHGLFDDVVFHRGFLHRAVVQDYVVYLYGEALFTLALLDSLVIDNDSLAGLGDEVVVGLLRGMPLGPPLKSLDMHEQIDTVEMLKAFLASPHLCALEELDLFLPEECEESVRLLAGCANLSRLRRLRFSSYGELGDTGLEALLDAPSLVGLTELGIDVEDPRFSTAAEQRYVARFGPWKNG